MQGTYIHTCIHQQPAVGDVQLGGCRWRAYLCYAASLQLRHIVLSCVELSGPYGQHGCWVAIPLCVLVCVCFVKTGDLNHGSATATAVHCSRVVAAAFVAYCVFFLYLGIPGLITEGSAHVRSMHQRWASSVHAQILMPFSRVVTPHCSSFSSLARQGLDCRSGCLHAD